MHCISALLSDLEFPMWLPGVPILYLCLTFPRRVVVARNDGYIILCNEDIENHKSSDVSNFDNRQNATVLPVRSVSKFPEKLPLLCSTLVSVTLSGHTKWSLWCGTRNEMIVAVDIMQSQLSNSQKLYNRSRYEVNETDCVVSIVTTESHLAGVVRTNAWAFTRPGNVLYCWDTVKERVLSKIDMSHHTTDQSEFARFCCCRCCCLKWMEQHQPWNIPNPHVQACYLIFQTHKLQ